MVYDSGEISITQSHSIITLLPKKDNDILKLMNWRPISLLNQDYKLAAKDIASLIKSYLVELDDIEENINHVMNIMEEAE